MSFLQKLIGYSSGNGAEVTSENRLKTELVKESSSLRIFSENDPGDVTGEPYLYSPETDTDFRLRVAHDFLLDTETFNYTAQNTTKHQYRNTTMTNTWAANGLQTNSAGITTTTTGTLFNTYAEFPLNGVQQLYAEMRVAFSALPVANTLIDFGFGRPATTNPFAPTDGAYFRLDAAGLKGVINANGTETETLLDFTYSPNQKYTFIVSVNQREAKFWIDDVLYLSLDTPIASPQPFLSSSAPFFLRHAIAGGAAGGVLSATLSYCNITVGGLQAGDHISSLGNLVLGSYTGLSGGTLGGLALYANSSNPTAAVPTNTTAALGNGLGGQFWETDTLAVTTDGIISSYQVPAGTVNVAGRTLILRGVTIDSYVQTGLTGGGYIAQWSLAVGHTSVSLATTVSATAKAPVRVPLGVQTVASAAVALTLLSRVEQRFDTPIYVHPGQFVQTVKKKIGTAPSGGVIGHVITFDYGWV